MRRNDLAAAFMLAFAASDVLLPGRLHAAPEWAPWAEQKLVADYAASTQREYEDRLRMKEPLENPRQRHVSQSSRDQYYNQLRQYDTPDFQPPQQMTVGVIQQYTQTLQNLFGTFLGSGSLSDATPAPLDFRIARPAVYEIPTAGCPVPVDASDQPDGQ